MRKPAFYICEGYTTLNIHEIWLRLFRGEHLLYIRDKMTSFVNSHDEKMDHWPFE